MQRTVIITGTTASGKTALAEGLCRELRSEIVSADTRCFFKGIEIGNGRFTMDMALPYRMMDLCDPSESFTLRRSIESARNAIMEVWGRGKVPIVCGGSMLIIERLLKGLSTGPDTDQPLREWLDGYIREFGSREAHAMLLELDAELGRSVCDRDARRVRRALEMTLTSLPSRSPIDGIEGTVIGYFLDWPDNILMKRIRSRAELMVVSGWVDEVKGLMAKYADPSIPAMEMTGVRSIKEFISGACNLDDLIDAVSRETMTLAKSQRRWLKRLPFQRIDLSSTGQEEIIDAILLKLDQLAE